MDFVLLFCKGIIAFSSFFILEKKIVKSPPLSMSMSLKSFSVARLRPKCALYDLFSISACGTRSHLGQRLLSAELSSKSFVRLAFLQVEAEFYRLMSTSIDGSKSVGKDGGQPALRWFEYFPRYQYDRSNRGFAHRMNKVGF